MGAHGPAGKLTLSRPRACEVSLSTELYWAGCNILVKSLVDTSLTGVLPVTADVDKCWTVDTRHLTVTCNE